MMTSMRGWPKLGELMRLLVVLFHAMFKFKGKIDKNPKEEMININLVVVLHAQEMEMVIFLDKET